MDINNIAKWCKIIESCDNKEDKYNLLRQLYRLGYEKGRNEENLATIKYMKENNLI